MQSLKVKIISLVLLLTSLICSAQAQSNYFSRIYIFGDSLSDTGNTSDLFKGFFPKSPPYDGGRLSNGKLWIENFSKDLYLPSELVINFAFAGARANQGRFLVPSLDKQISKFLKSKGDYSDPNALYVVWVGSNDLMNDEDKYDDVNVINKLSNQVKNQIKLLISNGAKIFLVPNIPAIDLTPQAFETDAKNKNTRYSKHIGQMTRSYNNLLEHTLNNLEIEYPDIKFIRFDAQATLENVSQYASLFGVTNIHQRCNPNGYLSNRRKICSNPAEYFFWDTVHPSAVGHYMISYFISQAVFKNNYLPYNIGYIATKEDYAIYNNYHNAIQELIKESRESVTEKDLMKTEDIVI